MDAEPVTEPSLAILNVQRPQSASARTNDGEDRKAGRRFGWAG
jgi:hypothetical protein